MKPVLTFALGAAVASGVVYYAVKQDPPPAPAPVAVTQPAPAPETPAPAAEQPATPVAAVQPPAEQPVAEPARATRTNRPKPVVQRPSASSKITSTRTEQPSAPKQSDVAQISSPAPVLQPPIPVTPAAPPPEPVVEEKKPEPRKAQTVTIPAGTLLSVRLDEELSSEKNQPGDVFRVTLDQPLVVDGFVIAERGARGQGRIAEIVPGGRVSGLAKLQVELVTLNTADGQRIKVQTETFSRQAESTKKGDVAKVGAAAGIGAAIGAIAGGGKGAAIGAVIGGAAGTGGVMSTRGKAAEIPVETRLSFRLSNPVTVTEKLK